MEDDESTDGAPGGDDTDDLEAALFLAASALWSKYLVKNLNVGF